MLRCIIAAALAALLPIRAYAAFGVESTSVSVQADGDTTLAPFSHTVTAANLLIVTCSIGAASGPTPSALISSITFNGDALTLVVAWGNDGLWGVTHIWKRDNPDIATGNVAVTYSSNQGQGYCAASGFTDANLTLGATNTAGGTTANPSVTVTSTSGDFVVGAISTDAGPLSTMTANGTLLWEQEDVSSDTDMGAQYATAVGASTAVTWTQSTTGQHWSIAAVAISGTGGGGSIVPKISHNRRQRIVH